MFMWVKKKKLRRGKPCQGGIASWWEFVAQGTASHSRDKNQQLYQEQDQFEGLNAKGEAH